MDQEYAIQHINTQEVPLGDNEPEMLYELPIISADDIEEWELYGDMYPRQYVLTRTFYDEVDEEGYMEYMIDQAEQHEEEEYARRQVEERNT